MTASSSSYKTAALAAQDEWPEIAINTSMDLSKKVEVETMANKPETVVDIENVNANDLKSMKERDGFLYYSIPGVRSATVLMKDIEISKLGDSIVNGRHISCPSRLQTAQNEAESRQTVTRSSRISFECHPDLLLEDMLLHCADDLECVEDFLSLFVAEIYATQQ